MEEEKDELYWYALQNCNSSEDDIKELIRFLKERKSGYSLQALLDLLEDTRKVLPMFASLG